MTETRWVYFAHKPGDLEHVKIGITNHLRIRMRQLRCELYFAVQCDRQFAEKLEKAFHEECADLRLPQSEWLIFAGKLAPLITHVRRTGRFPWGDLPLEIG